MGAAIDVNYAEPEPAEDNGGVGGSGEELA
jgi:hypothetical protein